MKETATRLLADHSPTVLVIPDISKSFAPELTRLANYFAPGGFSGGTDLPPFPLALSSRLLLPDWSP